MAGSGNMNPPPFNVEDDVQEEDNDNDDLFVSAIEVTYFLT